MEGWRGTGCPRHDSACRAADGFSSLPTTPDSLGHPCVSVSSGRPALYHPRVVVEGSAYSASLDACLGPFVDLEQGLIATASGTSVVSFDGIVVFWRAGLREWRHVTRSKIKTMLHTTYYVHERSPEINAAIKADFFLFSV